MYQQRTGVARKNSIVWMQQKRTLFTLHYKFIESGRQLCVTAGIRVPDQVSTTMSRSSATSDMSTPAVSIYDSRRQTPL